MIFRSGSILIFRFHIVEVGSLSHYLQVFFTSQVVVWDF